MQARTVTGAGTLSPTPVLTPAPNSDPRFGVVDAYRAPRDASAIGARWERNAFWWKALQPNGPRSWNFFATDRDHQINSELRAGRKIVGELINTPDWAAVNPREHGASVPKGLYLPFNDPRNYWGHFVSLIAKRYAGRIDQWIIWNEVSIPSGQWHTWDGTRADYAQLVKVAYLAATAANPRAQIILAGDPYWYDRGAWFADLLRRLTQDPQARSHHDYFDVVNLHLYNSATQLVPVIASYRRMLARFGLHRPIWLAETNAVPYNDPVRRYPRANFYASLDDQASFIIQTYAIALSMGAQRIEVNRLTDGADFIAGGVPLGLVRNNGTVRPAFYAYRTVSTLFSHVMGGSLTVQPASGVYTVTLQRPDALITVTWDQHPVAATTTIAATGAGATLYDKFGQSRTLSAVAGRYRLPLAPATDNSDAANPQDYVVGGSPLILVQPRAQQRTGG
ncbi:MAG TPA: hypothetical protein VHB98_19970 [Chloroflexota bacterium]|nr:hypothetical protein [Chloroflexota bacterium]